MKRIFTAWLVAVTGCALLFFALSYLLGFDNWSNPMFWKFSIVMILFLSVSITTPIYDLLWRRDP